MQDAVGHDGVITCVIRAQLIDTRLLEDHVLDATGCGLVPSDFEHLAGYIDGSDVTYEGRVNDGSRSSSTAELQNLHIWFQVILRHPQFFLVSRFIGDRPLRITFRMSVPKLTWLGHDPLHLGDVALREAYYLCIGKI